MDTEIEEIVEDLITKCVHNALTCWWSIENYQLDYLIRANCDETFKKFIRSQKMKFCEQHNGWIVKRQRVRFVVFEIQERFPMLEFVDNRV
jgi:hypothetical protein